jgi:isopenicillin N synthase-like dioxygenase
MHVIDFSSEKLKPGTTSWTLTSKDVQSALEEYGCFIAVYDKVSNELENAIFHARKQVFELPTETKLRNVAQRTYYAKLKKCEF